MIEVVGADRMRVQLEAREIGHPHQGGRLVRHDLFGRAPGGEPQRDALEPWRARLRRALLEEELAADAVGIADQDVGPAAGSLQGSLGHSDVVAREIELGVAGLREQDLAGLTIAISRPPTVRISCSGPAAIA